MCNCREAGKGKCENFQYVFHTAPRIIMHIFLVYEPHFYGTVYHTTIFTVNLDNVIVLIK